MYSILTFIVTAKVIDLMIDGFEDYVGLMIVSEQTKKINKKLLKNVGAGTTLYKGSGGFGKRGEQSERDIIHIVINRIDIKRTYRIINEIDDNAFIIEFDVNNIQGGVYNKYRATDLIKKLGTNK
jgi:uncharacterized membrane-anchored protein YitT (DUF2179 family)